MLIDGHLRADLDAEQEWDVAILDLTPEEADKLLACFDALSSLAELDQGKMTELFSSVDTASDAVRDMLDDMLDKQAKSAIAEEMDLRQEYSVLIHCEDEANQRIILEELAKHGLDTRAIVVDFPKVEQKEAKPGPKLKDGEIEIVRSSQIERTARVMQCEGMFDVPPAQRAEEKWRLKIELDRPWNIGLIVGASGSGKTTVAREVFGQHIVQQWPWTSRAIIDDFPDRMGIADITALLSSVGFSSPPSWLKPFAALSNGEQFRVTLARTLAEQPDLAVVDEFTSVVDRTVAQIGSAALAKTIRGSGRQFIAVACHYDIEEWLQPDWKIEMPSGQLTWRSLRRRPEIELHIRRAAYPEWENFKKYHYLASNLNKSATCFVAEINGRPAAFTAAIHNPHAKGGFYREHRTVCHPDFQGVGIGNKMSEYVASVVKANGKKYTSTTSHPAMIRHRLRSPLWRCYRLPDFSPARGVSSSMGHTKETSALYRMVASFEYVGQARPDDARALGVIE